MMWDVVGTDNMADYVRQLQRFNVGEDCPVFDGLYEYCQIYASGSIGKTTEGRVLLTVMRCLTDAHLVDG